MQQYYLSSIIGDGKEQNPYRSVIADYNLSHSMIDLRRVANLGLVVADTVSPIKDDGIKLTFSSLKEKIDKNVLYNLTGVYIEESYLPEWLLVLLTTKAKENGLMSLKPGADGKLRINLGGLIWGEPEPKYRKGTLTDSFNGSDSGTLGVDLSWTEAGYGEWEVKSNQAYCTRAGSAGWSIGIVDTALSTDDHYAQWVYKSSSLSGSLIYVLTRYHGTTTWYTGSICDSSPYHRLYKASGGSTLLGSTTDSIDADEVLKQSVDGSALKVYKNGAEIISTTDSDLSGDKVVGIRAYLQNGDYVYIDDFEADDLAVSQTISSAGAIPSAEALGTPQANLKTEPSSIASEEAIGNHSLSLKLESSGIVSAEAFGTSVLKLYLAPSGIAGAEAFGAAAIKHILKPSAIASEEAFGDSSLKFTIFLTGIASAEDFGESTVSLATQVLEPFGISSEEAFGNPIIELIIKPTGIAGVEAFGTAFLKKLKSISATLNLPSRSITLNLPGRNVTVKLPDRDIDINTLTN